MLFEFKIRGELDNAQIAAHRKLLGENSKLIRLTWQDIERSLKNIKNDKSIVESFLIEEFLRVIPNFKSKRRSSGMPQEIISHINKKGELHFTITGGRGLGKYVVEQILNDERIKLNSSLGGIQEARSWIANYVFENKHILPIVYEEMSTIISDYCILPGRPEKKNSWNQWRLGAFLKTK